MPDDITNNEVYLKIKEFIEESFTQQIKDLTEKLSIANNNINQLEKEKEVLRKEIKDLNRERKRNNLIIFGLPEEENEDIYEVILKLFNSTLKVETQYHDINCIYRFGLQTENRPVIVKFVSLWKKLDILKNCYVLQGKNISIANDLSKEDRETQKILRKHLKIARAQNKEAKIKNNTLIINNIKYSVEDLINIEKEQNTDRDEKSTAIPNKTRKQEVIEKPIGTKSKSQNSKEIVPKTFNYELRKGAGPSTKK